MAKGRDSQKTEKKNQKNAERKRKEKKGEIHKGYGLAL